ncbi:ArsC/Spx/MgsR family protein [Massilia sp. W12]|uniref:ArsC/Spx/MgsR family protein n=1 Tax=Massilia sp. W12 TaxID=3126507 RepID=UPI0030CBE942
MITLYHNPRCSKSREALSVLQDFCQRHQENLNVIEYLKQAPSRATLDTLAQALMAAGTTDVRAMLRNNEEPYAALHLQDADAAALLDALAQHPILLQRPLVLYAGQARIARPVDGLEEWLLSIKP